MAELDDDTEREEDFDASQLKTKSSKAWLALLTRAGKAGFNDYNDRCDGIDKQFASLERLASNARDRQFQIFWANIQVLGPSIYSRPPVPVVVPRFKDKRPLYRMAAELLERTTIVLFEMEDMDGIMRAMRDDLVVTARGVPWLRYDAKAKDSILDERVCIEHVHRKDFLHDPARSWKEVDWVAKRSWMTKAEMRKRFRKDSGDAYKEAAFAVRKDAEDNDDGRLKAAVWELWSKSADKVVWVTEGVEVCLDIDDPHLKLEGFFPCPKPAYGTVQRDSLIPVPDFVYYKDQIEEINDLTARIGALTEGLRLRGFYPAGAGEIGDAVEAAVKSQSDHQILIPISNWAALGGASAKDVIMWLPLDLVVATIKQCIENRRQLIDDVYQITGLSDIMRGATQANETLGAQQLKSQYGSIRIRDRQDELVRIARDVTRIASEIMAENFSGDTMLSMSQLQIPADADVKKQVGELQKQMQGLQQELQQAQSDPETQQLAQQNPEQAQQIMGQAQQQLQQLQGQMKELEGTVTIDAIMRFLNDQRTRPFVLDIETDSTIAPDENAAKQRANEALTAVGGYLAQAFPLVAQDPEAGPVAAEFLKYIAGQYRMGREVETAVEEYAERIMERSKNPQPNPEVEAAKAEAEAEAKRQAARDQAEEARAARDEARKDAEAKRSMDRDAFERELKKTDLEDALAKRELETGERIALTQEQRSNAAAKHQQEMEMGVLTIRKTQAEIERTETATENSIVAADAKAEAAQQPKRTSTPNA